MVNAARAEAHPEQLRETRSCARRPGAAEGRCRLDGGLANGTILAILVINGSSHGCAGWDAGGDAPWGMMR